MLNEHIRLNGSCDCCVTGAEMGCRIADASAGRLTHFQRHWPPFSLRWPLFFPFCITMAIDAPFTRPVLHALYIFAPSNPSIRFIFIIIHQLNQHYSFQPVYCNNNFNDWIIHLNNIYQWASLHFSNWVLLIHSASLSISWFQVNLRY